MGDTAWLTAEEAMRLLGVTRETLYAYVSRNRIRSEPAPGRSRRRRYSGDDIERLLARSRERRNPEKAAEQALHWGLPILESSITLIADGRFYYRGHDAIELATRNSLAEVAALVWTGTLDDVDFERGRQATRSRPAADMPFVPHAQAALARAAADDPLAFDLRPANVVQTGARILHLLTRVAMPTNARGDTIDSRLAAAWNVPAAADLIRAALILSADHELNVSSFTARCVASAGGSPYGAVIAGLAALEGFRHGGTTARIDAFWDGLVGSRNTGSALAAHLRRGEKLEGFGHPLYPSGDPRARLLLGMLPDSKSATRTRAFVDYAREQIGEHPTLDFALVAIARSLALPPGTPLVLFAIGRTIGWIAQAIEQYAEGSIIRPRAKYVGGAPGAGGLASGRRNGEPDPTDESTPGSELTTSRSRNARRRPA